MPRITNRRTSSEMYPLIKKWLESGQKKSKFCHAHQLPLHTFLYWEQKYREAEKAKLNGQGEFIELEITPPRISEVMCVEVSHPGGLKLCFSDLPPVSYLVNVLKALAG